MKPVAANSSVFLMIRFRETREHDEIAEVLERTLADYSIQLLRADWSQKEDELWANVRNCMDRCAYGIAVFETIHESGTSPNVSLELGFMMAQNKRCLLLKEKGIPRLHADLVGHLCREFDAKDIADSVPAQVRQWLRDLGLAKRPDERWLVFVSHGGTCRDPMARAITMRLAAEMPPGFPLQVKAVAIGPPTKHEASSGARRAIHEMFGEDLLANHCPTAIDAAVVRDADLILLMDHRLLNPKVFPLEKTFVLKPFFGLNGDVDDPWPDSGDDAAAKRYGDCCAELHQILRSNFEKLIEFLRSRPALSA
jgi:protein-tyrosine-phosphatase/nucleoside 2-deoxyribosyltransferase